MKKLTEEQIENLKSIKEEIEEMKNEFLAMRSGAEAAFDQFNVEEEGKEKVVSVIRVIQGCLINLEIMDTIFKELCVSNDERKIELDIFYKNGMHALAGFSYEIASLNKNEKWCSERITKITNSFELAFNIIS